MFWRMVLVIIFGSTIAALTAQAPAPGTLPATHTLTGIVVDAETGSPVRRVRVRALGSGQELPGGESDAEGRFAITGLSPGKYIVAAFKGGYLNSSYGQARHGGPGLPVTVPSQNGVLKLAISRGGVISGRVLDESGEPAINAPVHALRFTYSANGRQLSPVASEGARASTDDQGAFRLFALPPGDYYIVTRAAQTPAVGAPVNASARQPVTTYYPNAIDASSAQPIRVVSGEERPPITITLGSGRPAQISGRVVKSTGEPVGSGYLTVSFAQDIGLHSAMLGAGVRPDGTFQTAPLPPGRYRISLSTGMVPPPEESGGAIVDLDGTDISDLLIVTRKRAALRGHVVFDAREGTKVTPRDVVVQLVAALPAADAAVQDFTTATPKDDMSFDVQVPPGKYYVAAFVRSGGGWTVSDVLLDQQRLFGQAVDVDPERGLSGVTVVVTNRTVELRGRVTNANRQPLNDAWVVLFPRDSREWHSRSPLIAGVQADVRGEYRFAAVVPSDDYLISAVPGSMIEPQQWHDPVTLQMLRAHAQRLTVDEQRENVVNLQVGRQ